MYVDLTKPEEPDEPAVDELAPAPVPVPAVVEKESVRLTAREELMLPLRAFGAAVAAGSPVLVARMARAAWEGVQKASQTQSTPAPAPAPAPAPKKATPAVDFRKDDEPAADSDSDSGEQGQETEKAAPPAKAAATTSGFGDTMERLAMGALVVGAAFAILGGALSVVWVFAADYVGWIVLALVVGWCLAAAHHAPACEEDEGEGDTPVNDHENASGEQPQERAPETDPAADWARRRSAIRHFVEGAVAAGAAGFREEKGRGATVDSMLAEMRLKNPLPGWDRKRMIEFLELADIPVRDQVSFYVIEQVNGRDKKVKKNLPAVHVEDLTKELGKTPSLPPQFVADNTPSPPPHLAAVPPLVEAPAEAPVEGHAEGRSGVA